MERSCRSIKATNDFSLSLNPKGVMNDSKLCCSLRRRVVKKFSSSQLKYFDRRAHTSKSYYSIVHSRWVGLKLSRKVSVRIWESSSERKGIRSQCCFHICIADVTLSSSKLWSVVSTEEPRTEILGVKLERRFGFRGLFVVPEDVSGEETQKN